MMLLGSIAHAKVGQIGLLTNAETEIIVTALEEIIIDVEKEISSLKTALKTYIQNRILTYRKTR
jgi:hypothetical protein